ncbi:zinc ribbon domain-containing protein [Myxococcus landrumensis]|uniref:Zinc ribbon domain-containing protein n=1 Tax=Myxococcus landrumensis TaxID=2813577 RepID=A0ABX7N8M3_9BACT|nr:zinc ribbon domain-containing protein [Myxococcus landrumus]QSQ15120.1 zinc ribbon domain-containing protein [Myxococcus landrumus]
MRCPECGEASNGRLKYCENCGAKMPESPQGLTGSRSALRSSKPKRAMEEPSYAAEILDEVDDHRQDAPRQSGHRAARVPEEAAEDTDPGQSRPRYDGPRWLASVPAHSQSVVGLAMLSFALALTILPSFESVGVVGTVLAVAGAVLLLARELRLAGEGAGFTRLLPEVLYRPEVPAAYSVLLAALTVRMLGLGFSPLLWLLASGLIIHDQYRKVIAGPEGVLARYFDLKRLLLVPEVLALGGVALCLLTLYAPWHTMTALPVVADAPVPAGPPELKVIGQQRPVDDSLYSAGSGVITLAGWDLSGAVLFELLLISLLGLLALKPDVSRPAWTRFAPAGVVGLGLVWALLHMRLVPGPLIFVVGLGAMGFQAFRYLTGWQDEAAQVPAPAYNTGGYATRPDGDEEDEPEPDPNDMYPDDEPEPDPDDVYPDDEEADDKPRGR